MLQKYRVVAIVAAIPLTLRRRVGVKSQNPAGQVMVTARDRVRIVKMASEVAKAPDGGFYNKVTKVVNDVSQTLGLPKAEFTKMGLGSRDVPNCP